MVFWRAYYHLIWATKDRHPLITTDLESELYRYIIGKAQSLDCVVHAIGGVADHVHLVASVPPKLAMADFVQKIKGSSAHFANHDLAFAGEAFGWQRGYGLLTLGSKQLDVAVAYVQRQKAHHEQDTAIAALEQTVDEDEHVATQDPGPRVP